MDVTFLLLSYNQEAYVAEAIRAALAQEGPPISIFISDDASTDETFEIIKKEVSSYSGPHSVEINRNPQNLGIATHISACMKRIKTNYVIAAAGDDISLPQRSLRVQQVFSQTNALLIHSLFEGIDQSGRFVVGEFMIKSAFFMQETSARRAATKLGLYVGATGAWHKSLFDIYGDIGENCYEDLILGFRASLENKVAFINEPLVKYRLNSGVSAECKKLKYRDDWSTHRRRALAHEKTILEQRLWDTIRSSSSDRDVIINSLQKALRENALRLNILELETKDFLGKENIPLREKLRIIFNEGQKKRKYNRKLMSR